MGFPKRYSCHRIYDKPDHYLAQPVVTIAPNGELVECKSLAQETPFTEWIGGVMIVSPHAEMTLPSHFKMLLQETTKGASPSSPLYVWHISDFNFQEEEFTPRSIIRRLPFSV